MSDDNVIGFPGQAANDADEPGVLQCGCGCITHYVHANGDLRCSGCGSVGRPVTVKADVDRALQPERTIERVDFDDLDFLFRRFARRTAEGEFFMVIGIDRDGDTSALGAEYAEGDDQKAWLRERLRAAERLLTRER